MIDTLKSLAETLATVRLMPSMAMEPFFDNVAQNASVCLNGVPDGVVVPLNLADDAGAVNMAADDMTAKPSVGCHGPLQIDGAAAVQLAQ